MVLKTSPTASGVVVCWRIRRNACWFSAGVASSIQNSWQGSSALPRRAASIGGRRWGTSCSRWGSAQAFSRVAWQSAGAGGVVGGGVGVCLKPVLFADALEQPGRVAQVFLARPVMLGWQVGVGRLVEQPALADGVALVQARHAALRANRLVAGLDIAQHLVERLLDVAAVGMAVDHDAGAALAAEQLVQRQARSLGLEIPQRR